MMKISNHINISHSRYEEYPTNPASFVLNGFIYSLLGLYDLNATAPTSLSKEAGLLFDQGMVSLKKMLLFFDTGSGTIYDLRHIILGNLSTANIIANPLILTLLNREFELKSSKIKLKIISRRLLYKYCAMYLNNYLCSFLIWNCVVFFRIIFFRE